MAQRSQQHMERTALKALTLHSFAQLCTALHSGLFYVFMSPWPLKGFSVVNDIVLVRVISLRTRSKIYGQDHSQIMMTWSSTLTCWCHWKNWLVPLIPAKWDIQNTVIHSDQSRTYESRCFVGPLMSSMHWPTWIIWRPGVASQVAGWILAQSCVAGQHPCCRSRSSTAAFSGFLEEFLLQWIPFRFLIICSLLFVKKRFQSSLVSCRRFMPRPRRLTCQMSRLLSSEFFAVSSQFFKTTARTWKNTARDMNLLCQILSLVFADDDSSMSSLDRREDMLTSLAWALEYKEQLSSMQNLFVAVHN